MRHHLKMPEISNKQIIGVSMRHRRASTKHID